MSTKLELLDPTHRGLHRFVPRHIDEIEIDIGDPVYVQKEAEDLWCEGKTKSPTNYVEEKLVRLTSHPPFNDASLGFVLMF
jgi:hypothetical protein